MHSQTPLTGHVFISYSREDQVYVRRLADNLRGRGFEIWMDDRIDFGDQWWREIVKAIRASAAFVVVMTPDSEGSDWVEREVLLALEEGKPIFPLLLRGQRFPLLISVQYADVTDGQMPPGDFYERLARVGPAKSEADLADPRREDLVSVYQLEAIAPAAPAPGLKRHRPFEQELIRIPAGEFRMGSDPEKHKGAYDAEQPQHRLHLPEYSIAKTPVTNIQYLAFVQAAGQKPPRHWEGGKPPGSKEDHPVVYVTWRDAMDYCQWLAEATGKAFRLPSEAEWEKAARGTDGRIWPWGNEWDPKHCNTGEGGPGDTTPLGQYSPGGDSPYGCVDMGGNVWEWTLSLWGKELGEPGFKYPYDPEDGRENLETGASRLRVVRGGSFGFSQRLARCASRGRGIPVYRLDDIGFRVVVAPGSASDL